MSTQISKSFIKISSALLAVSMLSATPALAKIKDIKFHFIQSGSYSNSPAMEMKFQQGEWQWVNKKSVKVPAKIKIKGHPEYIDLYAFDYTGTKKSKVFHKVGGLKNFEKVVTTTFKTSFFQQNISGAKKLCGVFGGKSKIIRDMQVKTLLQASDNTYNKNSGYKYGKMNVKVTCHPKVVPGSSNTGGFVQKIKDLKLYTIPAKPLCGQPFKLVTTLKANTPAKASLKLLRNNGMSQNFNINPKKGNGSFSGMWLKNYNIKQTESRAYKVIVNGKAIQTPWHKINIKCVQGASNALKN